MENKEKKVIEKLLKKLNKDKENLISTTKDNVEGLIINYREDAKAYTNCLVTIDRQDVELGDYLVNLCDSYKAMLSDCKNVISFYKEDSDLYNSLVVDIVDIYSDYIAALELAKKYAKATNNEKMAKSYEKKIEKAYLEEISYYANNEKNLNDSNVKDNIISLISDLVSFEKSKDEPDKEKIQSYTDMINKLSSPDELDNKTIRNLKHYSFTKGKKYALVSAGIAVAVIVVAISAKSCNNKKTDTNTNVVTNVDSQTAEENVERNNATVSDSNKNTGDVATNNETTNDENKNDNTAEDIMALIEEKQDKDEISYDEFMETYKNVCSKYFIADSNNNMASMDMDSILTMLYYMNIKKLSRDALDKLQESGIFEEEKIILSALPAFNIITQNNIKNVKNAESMINVSEFSIDKKAKEEIKYLESLVDLIANGTDEEAKEAYIRIGDTFVYEKDEGYCYLDEYAKYGLKHSVLVTAHILAMGRGINYESGNQYTDNEKQFYDSLVYMIDNNLDSNIIIEAVKTHMQIRILDNNYFNNSNEVAFLETLLNRISTIYKSNNKTELINILKTDIQDHVKELTSLGNRIDEILIEDNNPVAVECNMKTSKANMNDLRDLALLIRKRI